MVLGVRLGEEVEGAVGVPNEHRVITDLRLEDLSVQGHAEVGGLRGRHGTFGAAQKGIARALTAHNREATCSIVDELHVVAVGPARAQRPFAGIPCAGVGAREVQRQAAAGDQDILR